MNLTTGVHMSKRSNLARPSLRDIYVKCTARCSREAGACGIITWRLKLYFYTCVYKKHCIIPRIKWSGTYREAYVDPFASHRSWALNIVPLRTILSLICERRLTELLWYIKGLSNQSNVQPWRFTQQPIWREKLPSRILFSNPFSNQPPPYPPIYPIAHFSL